MNIEVKQYSSVEDLVQIFEQYSRATRNTILSKFHIQYFERYLRNVRNGPITLVIEKKYVDRDYLEDYAAYYSRCFKEYERFCARVHFFNIDFNEDDFFDVVTNTRKKRITQSDLQDNYVGFVVIKPLPNAIIGRTRLAVYNDESNRVFPVNIKDKVCLCGIYLPIDSLAYQEQDSVAAACATSALWTSFHGTGRLFQHEILSPIEITRRATEKSPIDSRSLPSAGLSLPQMAAAVKSVGLEPYTVNLVKSDSIILKTQLYAYSAIGIPCILNVELIDFSDESNPLCLNFHSVTITGYNINNATDTSNYPVFHRAVGIDKLYVHDDQIGPFSKVVFEDKHQGRKYVYQDGSKNELLYSMSSSWPDKNNEQGNVYLKPIHLLIPLYHKIRIPFEIIQKNVSKLDHIIKLFARYSLVDEIDIKWDVFLSFGKTFKNQILLSRIDKKQKIEVLTMNIPRFIWRARAYSKDMDLFEVIFDATDIERGDYYIRTIDYRISYIKAIKKQIKLNLSLLEPYYNEYTFLRSLSTK